jgi:hypothetical protein
VEKEVDIRSAPWNEINLPNLKFIVKPSGEKRLMAGYQAKKDCIHQLERNAQVTIYRTGHC